ncbi:MAG: GatB/YqeY domain-containing protein [Caldilineaceae bacterium]
MSETQTAGLQERIEADLKQAMRDRNEVDKLALRNVKTALTLARTATANHSLSEAEVLTVLQKEAKRRRDTADEYKRLGAAKQAEGELAELAVIERYLPRQLSEAELEEIVRAVIAEKGATSMKEMGAVMSGVMARVTGVADGKAVNQIVRRLLS